MYSAAAIALEPVENIRRDLDDQLADFIRSLTREEAETLWRIAVQKNPRLAD
jgi:hypothetical protein